MMTPKPPTLLRNLEFLRVPIVIHVKEKWIRRFLSLDTGTPPLKKKGKGESIFPGYY